MRTHWPPNDDRLSHRGRDDQNLPSHTLEERNMHPPAMMPPHSVQPPDPMYSQQLPPPSEMWPQVTREPMIPVPPPAPRQRTAIACRYCRRRKIRCSGFDSSPDGRCGNCLRFNQECVFTPVSSQAQAFVPAHTQYPHLKQGFIPPRGGPARPTGQLYGSYGQPLPLHAALPQPGHQGDYPHHSYGRPPSPSHASQYNRPYEDQAYDRRRGEDRPPSLPPLAPNNYPPHNALQRRGSAGDYPSYWQGTNNANQPSSPPATLPPPRQYSPTRNSNYGNGSYPLSTLSGQSHRPYSTADYDRSYQSNGQSQSEAPATTGQPPQRRLSDPRGSESRKEQNYPSEGGSFHYSTPVARSAPGPLQSPPRSSSAGPQANSHPAMQLSNLIDPNPPHRSDVDARMLKSLNFKT
ncbi:hypothetical protein H072_5617 [Dactylellina haptotyla CBS 200.50]|uniref:Zn(2)-C6 fungal-type domain-containing protein n=1 Tax=Dactylellina haptotyla (strain CBS 200.50) TaxID=1284197 RepID=S8AH94_DACHA|nr:hypothetical protein H072_5617 [Dactylellina haptotyla CBS 200.50]